MQVWSHRRLTLAPTMSIHRLYPGDDFVNFRRDWEETQQFLMEKYLICLDYVIRLCNRSLHLANLTIPIHGQDALPDDQAWDAWHSSTRTRPKCAAAWWCVPSDAQEIKWRQRYGSP